MKILKSIDEVRKYVGEVRKSNATIGLVPTMGALHKGHISLGQEAFKYCQEVIYSIYVNPTQFNASEDLGNYPKSLKEDITKLSQIGVKAVFLPENKVMYPENYATYIINDENTKVLCGKYRDGHFKGVLTVVLKLLNIVNCDYAFFGEKDRQQLLIIKSMVADLNLSVKIIGVPIVREDDGLAMSSRNRYLSKEERQVSLKISQALKYIKENNSAASLEVIVKQAGTIISDSSLLKIQYLEVRDENLQLVTDLSRVKSAFVFAAVYAGKTRLIDNLQIK